MYNAPGSFQASVSPSNWVEKQKKDPWKVCPATQFRSDLHSLRVERKEKNNDKNVQPSRHVTRYTRSSKNKEMESYSSLALPSSLERVFRPEIRIRSWGRQKKAIKLRHLLYEPTCLSVVTRYSLASEKGHCGSNIWVVYLGSRLNIIFNPLREWSAHRTKERK